MKLEIEILKKHSEYLKNGAKGRKSKVADAIDKLIEVNYKRISPCTGHDAETEIEEKLRFRNYKNK